MTCDARLPTLEELYGALMLFRSRTRGKRSEIPALAALGIELA